jgi:hypothetical protein
VLSIQQADCIADEMTKGNALSATAAPIQDCPANSRLFSTAVIFSRHAAPRNFEAASLD